MTARTLAICLAATMLLAAACGGTAPVPSAGSSLSFPPFEPARSLPPEQPPATFPSFAPATFPALELPPTTFPPVALPPATMAPGPVEPGSDGAGLRLIPQAIWDPAAGDIPAVTFLLPEGWQAEGSVLWMYQWSRLAHLETRIADPASGITIEWLPVQDFIYFQPPAGAEVPIGGNYQGKAFVPPISDPVEFVNQFWLPGPLAHLQAATLASVTPVPVVAEEFERLFGGPADSAAYRLRYHYQLDGRPWEEDVFFALLQSGSAEMVSWYVNFAYTVRAPQGVLDQQQGLISTVVASRTTTPEWEGTYRLVQGLFRQGIAQQMADTVAFGRALAQYRAESQALQQQVVDERWASQDRIAELRRQSLGGVQTYVNPVSQQLVELPVGWHDYWVNPQGEYLISDTPGFDPNSVDNSGWQRLQAQP